MNMASLFSNPLADVAIGINSKVLYSCECKEFKSISKLYFCKHCTKLRCSNCVSHEVDSFFCPNCLENMPSAEAKLKRNRCANCFDCPSCGHTLSVRATTVVTNPLQEMSKDSPAKKMHYLSCSFCRWTTRDVGLDDQVTPSGGWPERDLPVGKTMGSLLTYYKQLAHNDKIEKERQKMTKRRTNIYMMDRYGYGLSLGKKGSPLSALMSRSSNTTLPVEKTMEAPVASEIIEEFESLPDSIYNKPLMLNKVLSLEQKLREPGIQASDTKSLYPKHKHLMVRRSQRCKECEHNIFKPEFNPSSIKFKIQLGCLQYCPLVQILKHDNFIKDEAAQVVISITNPLDTLINVRLEKVDETYHGQDTAEVDLPLVGFPISAKDATVEFDVMGSSTADKFDDDPSVVHSRGPHKICVYATVTPKNESGAISCSMKLTYVYKTVTTPLLRRTEPGTPEAPVKPEEHEVSLPMYVQLNFGDLNTSLC